MYDGMTFPEVQPASWMNTVKGWFTGKDKKDVHVPHHEQVQADCLKFYLQDHERILKNLEFTTASKLNFMNCVNGIDHVFRQLHSEGLFNNLSYSSSKRSANGLPKVSLSWL